VTVNELPAGPWSGASEICGPVSCDDAVEGARATHPAAITESKTAIGRPRMHIGSHIVGRTGLPLVLAAAVLAPAPAVDGGNDAAIELEAEVAGQDLERADANRPAELTPDEPVEVHLVITNPGSEPVFVRSVRLEGSVLGLTFFNFETVVGLEVDPGATAERAYPLDLIGLEGQATGLIPSELQLLDQERSVLASQGFTADVRGSMRSVYALFGLAVALFTALTLAACCVALARHRLSPNRFRRGLQFLVPGLGLGLTATFTLSALRVVAPGAGLWVPLTIGCGAALFVIGYLTPAPDDELDDELADDEEDEAADDDAAAADGNGDRPQVFAAPQPGEMPTGPT
jgi:hypothetical protein